LRTSALFGTKNFGFFEVYGVSPTTKGESIFRDYMRTSFMDGDYIQAFCYKIFITVGNL